MGKYWKVVGAVAMLSALGACDHVRTHSVSQKHGDFTVLEAEASDHLVYVGRRGKTTPVVCAMPSPDGIDARSTSASFSGGVPKASGSAAFANSEAAAFVGMRTQTIQLLRDGYYRLCEAYMNQAISREQYNLALVNMPGIFASLMAIDTIAGAAVAPAVAISAGIGSTKATNERNDTVPGGGAPAEGASPEEGDAPEGGEASAGEERSSKGSAETGSKEGAIEFKELQRASAINDAGKEVLLAALHGSRGGTYFMPAFCASVLSDSDNEQGNVSSSFRSQFLGYCLALLDKLAPTTVANMDDTRPRKAAEEEAKKAKAAAAAARAKTKEVEAKHKETLKKLAEIQAAIAKIEKINNPSEQAQKDLKALQQKFLDLADDMARDLAKGASGSKPASKDKNAATNAGKKGKDEKKAGNG